MLALIVDERLRTDLSPDRFVGASVLWVSSHAESLLRAFCLPLRWGLGGQTAIRQSARAGSLSLRLLVPARPRQNVDSHSKFMATRVGTPSESREHHGYQLPAYGKQK